MKRSRPIFALPALMSLFLGASTSVSQAQPPPRDPFFDDAGPLFDDGPDGRQPPPPRGFDGRGPRGRSGQGQLDGAWHNVERLMDGANRLSKAQAKSIVALVKPWSNRSAMSESDAQKLTQNIGAVLTDAQKSDFGPPRDGDFGPPPPRDGNGGPPRRGGNDGRPPRRGGNDGRPPRRGDDFGPPPDDFGPPPPRGGAEFGPPNGGRGNGQGQGQGRGGPRFDLPASFNPFYAPTGRSDWKTLSPSTRQFLARRYRENRAVLESLSRFSKS